MSRSGLTTARHSRRRAVSAHPHEPPGETHPVLMFTVDDTHAMEMRGLDSGADDYIAKVCRPEVLIARDRGLLRKGRESERILGCAQPHMKDIWMLAVDDSPTYLEKIVSNWNEKVTSARGRPRARNVSRN